MNIHSSGKSPSRTGNTLRFPKIILPITAAAVILLLTVFFSAALLMREKEFLLSSDYSYMENTVIHQSSGVFLEMAEEYVSEHITKFENRDEVMNGLTVLLSPDKLSFARAAE